MSTQYRHIPTKKVGQDCSHVPCGNRAPRVSCQCSREAQTVHLGTETLRVVSAISSRAQRRPEAHLGSVCVNETQPLGRVLQHVSGLLPRVSFFRLLSLLVLTGPSPFTCSVPQTAYVSPRSYSRRHHGQPAPPDAFLGLFSTGLTLTTSVVRNQVSWDPVTPCSAAKW